MTASKSISEGDSFTCPYCQSASIAKSKTEYDGFIAKRKYLVCAFCGAELIPPGNEQKTKKKTAKHPEPEKLSSLFGEDGTTDAPVISDLLSDDRQRRFCKNCKHNFITPFKCYCELHQKEVEPLQDCPDFEPKARLDSL